MALLTASSSLTHTVSARVYQLKVLRDTNTGIFTLIDKISRRPVDKVPINCCIPVVV